MNRSSGHAAPPLSYRADIDGLRAIAVLSVVFFHAGLAPFKGGFLGVDVFFVISGYLITSILLTDMERNPFSVVIARFYERRARRILPALFVVLAASFLVALVALPPKPFADFSRSALAALVFVANVYFWAKTDYFSEPAELTPLLHTWSLAVEEQFYIVFPLLLAVAGGASRRTALIAALAGASLLAAIVQHRHDPAGVFYLAHYRAWELLLGALVAVTRTHISSRTVAALATATGIALIAGAVMLTGKADAFAGSIAATLGAALVIAFGGDHLPSRTLGARPMVAIGLVSYSLYLWHQPVFVLARSYMIDAPTAATYLGLIALCLALAGVTWRYVEVPFRRSVPLRPFTSTTAAAATALLAAFALSHWSNGWPQRYGSEALAILSAAPERGVAIRDGRPCRRTLDDACIIGDTSARPSFAVLGDSHAETLTEPISELLARHGRSAYVYTNVACPFVIGALRDGGDSQCAARIEATLSRLREKNISSVIVHDRSAAYFIGSFDNGEGGIEPGKLAHFTPPGFVGSEAERLAALSRARKQTMETLLDAGMTVYYIAPVPEVGWHVPRTLVKAIAQNRLPLTTSLARYMERNGSAIELATELSRRDRFVAVLPHAILCDAARCHTHRDGAVLYTDHDHLSADGARLVVDALEEAMRGGKRAQEQPPGRTP